MAESSTTANIPLDITDGGPDLIQFVDASGKRLSTNEVNERYAPVVEALTSEDARSMYRDMVMSRRLDAEGYALQRQGELGLWPSLLGQEAAQVGAARAMGPQDYAFPGYREHAVAYVRGVQPAQMLRLFRGVSHGGWDTDKHRFHLYTIVIGNQMLHATGYAMGIQRDHAVATGDPERDAAVLAFTGDGGTSQGDYNEALNFAAVANAPVVFFVQNNGYAISEPNSRQFRVPPYQRAKGFGLPGVRVDGNDVLATYAVTKVALDSARAGEGPTLVEAFTYRLGAHTTSDDPTRYRDAAEVDLWKEKDPLLRMRAFLLTRAHAERSFFDEVEAEANDFAADMRKQCREIPDPQLPSMFDHVYAEEHKPLERERDRFTAYLASFEGVGA